MTPEEHTKENYRLVQAEQQKRLDQFAQGDVVSLEREIALCRSIIEQAANAGHTALANNLLVTLSKLIAEHERARIRSRDLIPRDRAMSLAREVYQAVIAEFEDIPGWEERMVRVAARVTRSIEAPE